MSAGAKEKWANFLVCAALVALTLAVFWGARRCDFVNYDDPAYITSNEEVKKGLNAETIHWAFKTGAASNWHPLTWLSHLGDVSIFGLNPVGHHTTSIVIHAINAALMFLLLQSMTRAPVRSAFVAAIFAIHPLRVESVAWVSERKDVLSTFFWILSVWAYCAYANNKTLPKSRRGILYASSLLLFALGLMAKPMLVTLPVILLLIDYWPLAREDKIFPNLVVEKIPFFALAAASSVVTFLVQRQGGSVAAVAAMPILARVENVFVSYVRYIGKFFWPSGLSPLYPHPGFWPAWEVGGSLIIVVAITAAVLWQRKSRPYLMVGWLWFLIMLVPAIGLVQVGIQSMADRYTYVPCVGITIMLVWFGFEWFKSIPAIPVFVGAAGLAACVFLTPRQVQNWRDSKTLFAHAIAVTKDNYLACNNLGTYLSDHGEKERSIVYFEKSLAINPNYDEARNNLGFAYASFGRYVEATNEYIKALTINPKLADAHNNLGISLVHLGNIPAAIHEYQVALNERPIFPSAHNNYGVALAMEGKLDDAMVEFRKAISEQPDDVSAHSDLGNALAIKGNFDGAIGEYQECIKLAPKDAVVRKNYANALAQKGNLAEAAEQYGISLQCDNSDAETHSNFGYALIKLGRPEDAARQFQTALQLRPGYPAAQQQLDALRKAKAPK